MRPRFANEAICNPELDSNPRPPRRGAGILTTRLSNDQAAWTNSVRNCTIQWKVCGLTQIGSLESGIFCCKKRRLKTLETMCVLCKPWKLVWIEKRVAVLLLQQNTFSSRSSRGEERSCVELFMAPCCLHCSAFCLNIHSRSWQTKTQRHLCSNLMHCLHPRPPPPPHYFAQLCFSSFVQEKNTNISSWMLQFLCCMCM